MMGCWRSGRMLKVLTLRPILAGMAKKPEPPLSSFDVLKAAHKAVWIATVEAADEREAIEKVAMERNLPAAKLIAMRRR
jgi:hypothetical protein